jgi:excisionase family DNA binding protein
VSEVIVQDDVLLTFKEAMSYLRVSRATLHRLMHAGQLTGHKVGSTWRFWKQDLRACVGKEPPPPADLPADGRPIAYYAQWYQCSDKACKCQQKYAQVHPRWYARWKENGCWVSRYVGKDKPEGAGA